jgi:hypothetical protein
MSHERAVAYGEDDLLSDLKKLLAARKISLRSISTELQIPYRSIQNYFSGESRIPAIVLVKILLLLGDDIQYMTSGNYLLRHHDLYDSILSVIGDALLDLDPQKIGKNTTGQHRQEDHRRKQRAAAELSINISEAYDRFCREPRLSFGRPQTIAEIRDRQKRRKQLPNPTTEDDGEVGQ